jgi:hypothetical protein
MQLAQAPGPVAEGSVVACSSFSSSTKYTHALFLFQKRKELPEEKKKKAKEICGKYDASPNFLAD